MSEAVMIGPGTYLCRESLAHNRPLIDILAGHAEIKKHVTREQLEGFCDPANCLGQAGVMVDRVLAARKA